MPLVPKVEERRQSLRGRENDVTAIAAVSAVGPAARHKHLAAEATTPVAAATGFHGNKDFVDKHGSLACR
jgi:hypothetical protein